MGAELVTRKAQSPPAPPGRPTCSRGFSLAFARPWVTGAPAGRPRAGRCPAPVYTVAGGFTRSEPGGHVPRNWPWPRAGKGAPRAPAAVAPRDRPAGPAKVTPSVGADGRVAPGWPRPAALDGRMEQRPRRGTRDSGPDTVWGSPPHPPASEAPTPAGGPPSRAARSPCAWRCLRPHGLGLRPRDQTPPPPPPPPRAPDANDKPRLSPALPTDQPRTGWRF